MSYNTELLQKKFTGNVVIRFVGQYFAIRQPDSGLSITAAQANTVRSVVVNATSVDLKRVSQTIAAYSFKLVDYQNVITGYVQDRADALINQEVEIWIGRSGVAMDFADYFKLPIVKIKKVSHAGNEYNFACSEATDRMNKPIFALEGKLALDILAGTTQFTMQEPITNWPTSGFGRIDKEFFSWASVNLAFNRLEGIIRGEMGTVPEAYDAGETVKWVYDVEDNPLTLLLQILISGGGGGPYDVLPSGLGISASLIDVTGIESIRDTLFIGQDYSFTLYDIPLALKFIEQEILLPCNLRFKVSEDSKISVAVLDQAVFGSAPDSIDENTIASYPSWDVDDNKIVNVVEVTWDWDETTQTYKKLSQYEDADSITNFGERNPFKMQFKGIKDVLAGQDIIDDNIARFLARFATPNPEISFKTHIDKHLKNIGDKVLVTSSQIPTAAGTLQFATELEVISRGINFETGDVNFKLAFTSYSGIRGCYISPSDLISTVVNQKTVTIPAGRGDLYSVGWRLVLWNEVTQSFESDPYNTIESIIGDTITFVNNWATILIAGTTHRFKFVDYDDAVEDQKRYCYISDSGANFGDGASTYRVTF